MKEDDTEQQKTEPDFHIGSNSDDSDSFDQVSFKNETESDNAKLMKKLVWFSMITVFVCSSLDITTTYN